MKSKIQVGTKDLKFTNRMLNATGDDDNFYGE
jgi:hypothetical protein